ncbi:MAG: zinc-binding alcohol dehydrogenase [Myxococcota bacterium]
MSGGSHPSDAEQALREAQAFWVVAPGKGELRPAPSELPGPTQVAVQTSYSAVSRGTESLVFRGQVPASLHTWMRAPHQEGTLSLPVKYGYAAVGRVVAGVGVGRTVFCLYPHQTAFCVEADAVLEVPDDVPLQRAVLAANMETAVNALWDGHVAPGDRVVVVGGGVVGCLTAHLAARVPGCDVTLVDIDPERESTAAALGVAFAAPGEVEGGADVVFHASATTEGLQHSLDLVGREATVVELSWYGDDAVRLQLGGAFHPGRTRLQSSQVGSIPPHRAPRWTYRRRLALALRLVADARLDALISSESPFSTLPDVMPRLSQGPALCHRIVYS